MIGDCESSQRLLRLAASHSAGERQALATSLVDLLADMEPDLNDREAALIGDILNKLIDDFQTAVRRELANRLARLAFAPHDVIVALANDEIAVARPLLLQSSVLTDRDLIEIVQRRSRQHQMSITLRETLSEAVSDALVDTGDEAVITSLLSNRKAEISDATLAYLVEEARHVDSYQEPLVLREELNGDLARRIYFVVADHLKARILQRFDLDPEVLDGELVRLPDELAAKTACLANDNRKDRPRDRLAHALASSREITPDLLVKLLRAGKVDLFEASVGQLTGLDAATLQKVLYDPKGKTLAAICRAMGIPKAHFIEVYLLIRRARSRSETTPTRDVGAIVRYFDRIAPATAFQALAHWRGDGRAVPADQANRNAR